MYPFFFSVLIPMKSVFFMFDKSIDFFQDREIFISGVFFLMCNQVFHIVPIGLSTLALNKVFQCFEFA